MAVFQIAMDFSFFDITVLKPIIFPDILESGAAQWGRRANS
jgi:hypothetical protein